MFVHIFFSIIDNADPSYQANLNLILYHTSITSDDLQILSAAVSDIGGLIAKEQATIHSQHQLRAKITLCLCQNIRDTQYQHSKPTRALITNNMYFRKQI